MRKPLIKCIACYLVMALFMMSIVPRVYAGFSPSEAIALSTLDRSSDLEKIRTVLETKMIRERLAQFGFSEDEIQKRLGQLSDEQIHQLALNLDELRVGGDSGTILIIALAVALAVVLFLWISGYDLAVTR